MKKKGKKYVEALNLIEKGKAYTKEEAIELVKKTSTSKFDGSVEVAMNLNLDTKKTDQQLRGAIVLPNGTGKSTICKVLMHHPDYEVTTGSITFQNEDIVHKDTTDISRLGMFLLAQNPVEVEGITNAEMLRMALSEKTGSHVDIFKFSKEAKEICQKIGLPESFLHREINNGMSGGERKKNELLHVWMLKPSFLILDEIDSGLDVDALKIVANSIKEYGVIQPIIVSKKERSVLNAQKSSDRDTCPCRFGQDNSFRGYFIQKRCYP